MDHFKAGKCDGSCRRRPKKVGCAPSIETGETILLKHFLYAIGYARITLLGVEPLFLKPGTYNLQERLQCHGRILDVSNPDEFISIRKVYVLDLDNVQEKRRKDPTSCG